MHIARYNPIGVLPLYLIRVASKLRLHGNRMRPLLLKLNDLRLRLSNALKVKPFLLGAHGGDALLDWRTHDYLLLLNGGDALSDGRTHDYGLLAM